MCAVTFLKEDISPVPVHALMASSKNQMLNSDSLPASHISLGLPFTTWSDCVDLILRVILREGCGME